MPEPDGRRERAGRSIRRSAASAGAGGRGGSSSTSSTRSFPAMASPRTISCRTCRSAGGRWSRSRAPSPCRTAAGAPRHPRRADLLARRAHRGTAARLCAALGRRGLSCVLISHILGEVLETCDRILVMRDGKVVAEDRSRNLSRSKLVAAMGGVESEATRLSRSARGGTAPRRDPRAHPPRASDRRPRARRARRRDRRPRRARRPRPDRAAPRGVRRRLAPAIGRNGRGAGRPGRRRPAFRTAIFPQWSIAQNIGVRSLKRLRAGAARFAAPRGGARQRLAPAHQHPHARRRPQHPVALGRQPAEGAVRPRARLRRARRADGRPDARRRLRHEDRGLRAHPRRGRVGTDLPLVHDRDGGAEELRPHLYLPQRRGRRRAHARRTDGGARHPFLLRRSA